MNKHIFVTRVIPEVGLAMLREKGYEVDVYPKDRVPTQKELILYLKKKPYDAVLSLLTDKIDAKIFDSVPTAKMYANYAIGYDNFDLAEAKKRGITMTNTRGDFSWCVAEHTMALMLALSTRTVEGDRYVRKGKYKGWSPMLLTGTDLKGKTLGLVGLGRIGGQVAQYARVFGMRVLYYDVLRNETVEKECNATFCAHPEDVLRGADFVSLHVPLLPTTTHLMNGDRLKMMKRTAFLINTSRGQVVDEVALVSALKDGTIAGAGLDVFEFEPKLTRGLVKLPNVVLTPHIASARESARNAMAQIAAKNIIDFLETGRVEFPL